MTDPKLSLAGAILGLAYATDETAAGYWLAVCARRGADAALLRDLRDGWLREHRPMYLHTDGEEPRP